MLNASITSAIYAQSTSQNNYFNPNAPVLTFENDTIDYGTIEYNSDGNCVFKFKNTGKEPLKITDCLSSGSHVASWPKKTIEPGDTSFINVKYCTTRVGAFHKAVRVISNANLPIKVIYIKGLVKPEAPEISFDKEVMEYGTIEHNSDGTRVFYFTNTGKEDLIISNCQASGGFVPTWPKEPIKSYKTGFILVKYDTNRIGAFEKTLVVTSNAKTTQKVLKIKGVVKPDAPRESAIPYEKK